MASFLVVYDPTKGKEHEVVAALHRWGATRLFRGAWVIEFNSTADLARRALIAVGGAIGLRDRRDQTERRPRRAGRRARRPGRAPAPWRRLGVGNRELVLERHQPQFDFTNVVEQE